MNALEQVLDETRRRFAATFVGQCTSMRALVEDVAADGRPTRVAVIIDIAHRLSGLAGTIGFPLVSACAADLERLVDGAGPVDMVRVGTALDALEDAFAADRAADHVIPPAPIAAPSHNTKILVADDEADQRAIVSAGLRHAGYLPLVAMSGDVVVEMARRENPAVILLDIAMPGLDGYAVCRQLKADAALAHIPVMFLTAGANHTDKLAGLSLGADEFLSKPVDLRELVLRIQLLLKRCPPAAGVVALEPPRAAPAANRLRRIVIAEDDPDVARIIDAQVRAAGYESVLTVDGEQALAAVREHGTDVMVLDLMMPKRNGFDVLAAIRTGPGPRPRIIVLSGRGREHDVMRAFDLGTDDYMTKPFNPHELIARIARLLA